jgi:predicted phosphodiesterase
MKTIVISDTHFPYANEEALSKVMALIKKERPTHVVQIGDLLDQYALSRYARDVNLSTPKSELERGRKQAAKMWKDIQKIVPRAKCIQLLGNHDLRAQKRLMERLPEMESLVDIAALYRFPKVTTLKSDRDSITIDGVVYVHGWLSKSLDHAKHFNKPVVHGHRHRGAVETQGKLWSMDVGFLGDERLLPFSYTMNKVTNWTLGCGIVENGKPRLVLL